MEWVMELIEEKRRREEVSESASEE